MKKGGLAGVERGELMVLLRPRELKAASQASRRPLHQLQQHALAQPAARDPQRQRQQVRDRLQHEDAGGQQAHPLGVELEAGGHLRDRGRAEHADAALERLVRRARRRAAAAARSPCRRRRPPRAPAAARAPRRCRPRGGAPSPARRPRAGLRAGRSRRGSPSRSETRPTTPSGRPASPTAISLEPPPTSITAIVPSAAASSVRVAPTNDRRASSSPESTSSSMPPASSHGGQQGVAVGRVADRRGGHGHDLLRAHLARHRWPGWRTTSAVSAILSAGIEPVEAMLFPMRVKARWVTSSRSCPSPASATSSRVVLLPMSMQAQIKRWTAERAPGARRPRTPGTDR